MNRKEELFQKLVDKTRELDRQVSFSEMCEDPRMPPANEYAYYFGSFAAAASRAYQKVKPAPLKVAVKIKPLNSI